MFIKRIWDITLTVSNLERAVDFYENILGLEKKYQFKDYAGFDCSGVEIGLKTWGGMESPREGEPCVNFLVDSLEEAFSHLKRNRVNIVEGPKETSWGGKFLLFKDPDGNILQVTEIDWRKYFTTCAQNKTN